MLECQRRLVASQPATLAQLLSFLRAAAVPSLSVLESSSAVGCTADAFALRRVQQQQRRRFASAASRHDTDGAAADPVHSRSCRQPALSQIQQRRRSSFFASTSNINDLRCIYNPSRSFASQPAYAHDDQDHDHDVEQQAPPGDKPLTLVLQQSAVLPMDHAQELPPWESVREQRNIKIRQYMKEVHSVDQWSWSGQHSDIPFIGRSRFDPRTLHGPWMEDTATQADWEEYMESLAALPRCRLQTSVPEVPEKKKRSATLFDDSSDLEACTDADRVGELPRRRRRSKHTAAAHEELAPVEGALSGAAPEPEPDQPLLLAGWVPPRRIQDLSHTVPEVVNALRRSGVEVEKSLEAVLVKALAKVDPSAQLKPRLELHERGMTSILFTPQSAEAMVSYLIKELDMQPRQLKRLLIRAPWVLGVDIKSQVVPVIECLRHIMELKNDQIVRMVVTYPRTLGAQVDDHMLPLIDYMHSLGFSQRNIRRVFTNFPVFTESYSTNLLRTCVAFWLGKGMDRNELVSFIAQYPRVTSLGQSLVQLKYDWLKEHINYGVADHARNPILLARSLTENLGPRIAYALFKGFTVHRPTDMNKRRSGGGTTTAKEITQIGIDNYVKRLRGDKEEYLAFKEQWSREVLPKWLENHGSSLDYYHSMNWLKKHDTEEVRAWKGSKKNPDL